MALTDKEPWEIVPASATGFVQISVAGTAILLSSYLPANATGATINVEAAAADLGSSRIARVRMDGTAPTSAIGQILADGAQINLINQSQINNFKIISMTASTQKINVQFFYNTLTS
jgi:hypothetical protein